MIALFPEIVKNVKEKKWRRFCAIFLQNVTYFARAGHLIKQQLE